MDYRDAVQLAETGITRCATRGEMSVVELADLLLEAYNEGFAAGQDAEVTRPSLPTNYDIEEHLKARGLVSINRQQWQHYVAWKETDQVDLMADRKRMDYVREHCHISTREEFIVDGLPFARQDENLNDWLDRAIKKEAEGR